ncbi:MAG: glycosyltransferase family 4 protein [Spirochaetaceae bacterium]
MRVLYLVTRTDEPGGAQVHVRDLACRLAEDGHQVRVASGPPMASDYRAFLEAAGVQTREVPHLLRPIRPRADLAALGEITRLLREEAPDLVSLHSSKAGWLGRLAARRARVPCVFTAHGWSFAAGVPPLRARLYRLAERLTAGLCTAIITVSDADRRLALGARLARPERIVTVHNGMPDADTARRPHPALEGEAIRTVMVARFTEQKDHPTALSAMARIAEWTAEEATGVRMVEEPEDGGAAEGDTAGSTAVPEENRAPAGQTASGEPAPPPPAVPVELVLVGDGPTEYAMRRLAYDLGIDDRVRFLGSRSDVPEVLAACDLCLLATKWEGLPRSIIEALRAGLPVVATDLAGIPELVTHGDNGYLVDRGDVAELAEALWRLVGDEETRMRMGARARERYEEEFTFERMYLRTVAVYERVLGPGRGTAG